MVVIAAAAVAAFALAGPDSPEPGPTFAWTGGAGDPLAAGVFAPVVRRHGIQAGTLAELASTAEFEGERQLVVTGRRHDGAAMIAGGTARGARLTTLGSFVPVGQLGAAPVRPRGVNPFAGWDGKREVVGDRAIVRFEAAAALVLTGWATRASWVSSAAMSAGSSPSSPTARAASCR